MKPILFNTEMVRAILSGRKRQTRRVIKPGSLICLTGPARQEQPLLTDGEYLTRFASGPYRAGDVLYVREGFAVRDGKILYRADRPDGENAPPGVEWRPSIHMPMEYARIFLRVTGERAEHLCSISPAEASMEGCDGLLHYNPLLRCSEAVYNFRRIWDRTVTPGKRAVYGWDANPWVWVYEFEKIDTEEAEGV